MNDIELNQAVAYAAGWMYHDGWHSPSGEEPDCLPDFANSYDAIMPLVKALKKGREQRFVEKLVNSVYPESANINWQLIHVAYLHALITATPRQLCEAYLAVGGADA
jgi:hypothetical protein